MQLPIDSFKLDEIQVVMLALLLVVDGWLIARSVKHGEAIATLAALVTNHYNDRFQKIKSYLGFEKYDDEEDKSERS